MTVATGPDAQGLAADVAVVGGGLAGLATAIHLARRDHRVVCVEPRAWPRPAVGESLEFSAPALLASLGIDLDCGGESRHLYPKRSVQILGGGEEFSVWPPRWFRRPPIWCSGRAFHTDRVELDHLLAKMAVDIGVEVLQERVNRVVHDGDVITGLVTDGGTTIRARWFIDASGHACRFFGRSLGLHVQMLGPPRAAFWTRVAEPPDGHATRLYFPESLEDDLSWAWEIPLNADEVSVGIVTSMERVAKLRQHGLHPVEIFRRHVASIPRLGSTLAAHPDFEVHATSYTGYRHHRPIGPNWLLVGDAAAMVDPLTSNGVTSALRHADLGVRVVADALHDHHISRGRRWAYRNTAPAMAATLDRAIESFLYRPDVRQQLGIKWAVTLYAATGVITNSLFAKLDPTTVPRSIACRAMLAATRSWIGVASRVLPQALPLLGPVTHVRRTKTGGNVSEREHVGAQH